MGDPLIRKEWKEVERVGEPLIRKGQKESGTPLQAVAAVGSGLRKEQGGR